MWPLPALPSIPPFLSSSRRSLDGGRGGAGLAVPTASHQQDQHTVRLETQTGAAGRCCVQESGPEVGEQISGEELRLDSLAPRQCDRLTERRATDFSQVRNTSHNTSQPCKEEIC